MACVTLDSIKNNLLAADNGFAIDMVLAISCKAERDAEYADVLAAWLANGHTSDLRDTLCAPFKSASFISHIDRKDHPLPFHSTWEAIDSAWLRAKNS